MTICAIKIYLKNIIPLNPPINLPNIKLNIIKYLFEFIFFISFIIKLVWQLPINKNSRQIKKRLEEFKKRKFKVKYKNHKNKFHHFVFVINFKLSLVPILKNRGNNPHKNRGNLSYATFPAKTELFIFIKIVIKVVFIYSFYHKLNKNVKIEILLVKCYNIYMKHLKQKWNQSDNLQNNIKIQNQNLGYWPAVYVNSSLKTKEIYVGITSNILTRFKNHHSLVKYENDENILDIYVDKEGNRSSIYEFETELIRCLQTNFYLNNKKTNQTFFKYHEQEKYIDRFPYFYIQVLKQLKDNLKIEDKIFKKYPNLENKRNINCDDYLQDNYKISNIKTKRRYIHCPFILDKNQLNITKVIVKKVTKSQNWTNFMIQGNAGTGKTLVILKIWEELTIKNILSNLGNNIENKIYITTGKKNLIENILKPYIKETENIWCKFYPNLKEKVKYFCSNVIIINKDFKVVAQKLKNKKALLICDEAHGIIENVNDGGKFYFSKNNCLDKYKQNLKDDFLKFQNIFVFDPNQRTKQTTISQKDLIEIFKLTKKNIFNLEFEYRNNFGSNYVTKINKCDPKWKLSQEKICLYTNISDFMSEFINKQKQLKNLEKRKFYRLLTTSSYSWDNKNILNENLNSIQNRLNFNVSEEYKKMSNLNKLRTNIKAEKHWMNSTEDYFTFGYQECIIGNDLKEAFIVVGRDLILNSSNKLVPNLNKIDSQKTKLILKNGESVEYNPDNYDCYIEVGIKQMLPKQFNHQSNYFTNVSAHYNKNNSEFDLEDLRSVIINQHYILFSRATNLNHIFFEDEKLRNYFFN